MAASTLAASETFEQFLVDEKAKDLLRFTTAGSVDDGKSTMIGRLLYDSRNVYDDQLESVTKASAGRNAGSVDFSLLTDGLRAEREQGITIDVAYRYFATPRRKFIIADTPGHEQYTRNMVTGASTAELAIVLVDARKGLLPQSRRHAYIASLLGLPHAVIAINKMDLVGYDEDVFRRIESDFRNFLAQLNAIDPYFLPISALAGDNVVTPGSNMPWFEGATLLEHLETVPVGNRARYASFRFPVQRVVRPTLDFRGYAGTIVSGSISVDDPVVILPSGRSTKVNRIATFDGDLSSAQAGQAVTLTLADETDVTRGDVIAVAEDLPYVAASLQATVVWLDAVPSQFGRRYRLKSGARQEFAEIRSIRHRLNINTLAEEESAALEMNAIGAIQVDLARPLAFDAYTVNRITGSFVLIDPVTNATVAAGMIEAAATVDHPIPGKTGPVTEAERVAARGHKGAVIRCGGDRDLAAALERRLFERNCAVARFEERNDQVVQAFVQAGFLIVLTGDAVDDFQVEDTRERFSAPVPKLSGAETLLEEWQILIGRIGTWSESGGI